MGLIDHVDSYYRYEFKNTKSLVVRLSLLKLSWLLYKKVKYMRQLITSTNRFHIITFSILMIMFYKVEYNKYIKYGLISSKSSSSLTSYLPKVCYVNLDMFAFKKRSLKVLICH